MSRQRRVIIIDDEKNFAQMLGKELVRLGYETTVTHDSDEALARLDEHEFDLAILDIKMPGRNGIETLKELKERGHTAEVIMLTGHATIDTALEAMRAGAYDYLTKPCKLEELAVLLEKALEKREALRDSRTLRQYLAGSSGESVMVGESPEISKVLGKLDKIAQATDVPVLITGESGTGKELVAREIHHRGPQRDQPIVALNCAVLQANMLESELFGHEKGAFTGAHTQKSGLVEVAEGGTLFLDEIGEIDEGIQAKLLRFLQFGEYRRLGGTETLESKVRFVAATNRDLEKDIEAGRFREDLYYRLNVLQVAVPALRDRPSDIVPLFEFFLGRYGRPEGEPFIVEEDARQLLIQHAWPGNVRELENLVRRLLVFQEDRTLRAADLEECFGPAGSGRQLPRSLLLEDVEREHILKVLRLCKGHKAQTSETLGIALKTLYNKLNAYKADGLEI